MADLNDAELWRCVDATVLGILLPALPADEPWARAVAVQLVGLARYASARPADRSAQHVEEIADALEALRTNEIVSAVWDRRRSADSVMTATGKALAAAVTRVDVAAADVRSMLRPVVLRHLDDELAITSPLVDAFRGKLDG